LLGLRAALPEQGDLRATPHFLIDADKCTECVGDFADAQCVAICPIEGAILDELGVALNRTRRRVADRHPARALAYPPAFPG
jgi:ferredoxin